MADLFDTLQAVET